MSEWKYTLNEGGGLERLICKDKEIFFRSDEFSGPSLWIEQGKKQKKLALQKDMEAGWTGRTGGFQYTVNYMAEDAFHIQVTLKNEGREAINAERIFLRTGIDHYMESYPQWDEILFPTLLRCEKDFFWGYMMSPNGKIMVLTSDTPVRSWKLNYNKLYGCHNGHRIYTADIDLFHILDQPARHPKGCRTLDAGQEVKWDFKCRMVDDIEDVMPVCAELTKAPMIQAKKYTVEKGEPIGLTVYAWGDLEVELIGPSGDGIVRKIGQAENHTEITLPGFSEAGTCRIIARANGKQTEAEIYVRKKLSWYLNKARDAALGCQKASSHLEAWYGFFSIFAAARCLPDTEKDMQGRMEFDTILSKMYDLDTALPITEPGRLCNTSAAVSMLTDAFQAYAEEKYLALASRLGDYMIKNQDEDGSYRAYRNIPKFYGGQEEWSSKGDHYTSVLYAMKSMVELVFAEKEAARSNKKYERAWKRHYESAEKAADNLLQLLDDVGTEGEMTFEDGMISCSSLQLGLMSLLQEDGKEHEKYKVAAEALNKKHRCLQQMLVPDCRMHGATLRFWESQYDVLMDANMINSPHGWTSWKIYATYYLYLLTGKKDYLVQTMDTLGACLQMVNLEDGGLRWAFICDPYVKTGVWVKDVPPYYGRREKRVIGEQYAERISQWWKPLDDEPVGAYLTMPLVIRNEVKECANIGGCCDNDVHEHFKCLEETALEKCYFICTEEGEIINYNCTWEQNKQELHIYPAEGLVRAAHINWQKKEPVVVYVHFESGIQRGKVNGMQWVTAEGMDKAYEYKLS